MKARIVMVDLNSVIRVVHHLFSNCKIQEYIGGYNDWLQTVKQNVKQAAIKNDNNEN